MPVSAPAIAALVLLAFAVHLGAAAESLGPFNPTSTTDDHPEDLPDGGWRLDLTRRGTFSVDETVWHGVTPGQIVRVTIVLDGPGARGRAYGRLSFHSEQTHANPRHRGFVWGQDHRYRQQVEAIPEGPLPPGPVTVETVAFVPPAVDGLRVGAGFVGTGAVAIRSLTLTPATVADLTALFGHGFSPLWLASPVRHGPMGMDWPAFFARLDLTDPRFREVVQALAVRDVEAARRAYGQVLRQRPWQGIAMNGEILLDQPPTEQDAPPAAGSFAADLLANRLKFSGFPRYDFAADIDWSFDLPRDLPGYDKPYSHEWASLLHRQSFFQAQAAQYTATGHAPFARNVERQIRGWIRSCPPPSYDDYNAAAWLSYPDYLKGLDDRMVGFPAWTYLQTGIRLQFWSEILVRLHRSPSISPEFLSECAKSALEQIDLVRYFPNKGNGLTTALQGQAMILHLFPEFDRAGDLGRDVSRQLAMAVQDVPTDGMQYEGAPNYSLIVQESYRMLAELLPAGPARDQAEAMVRRMLRGTLGILRPDHSLPALNDSYPITPAQTGGTFAKAVGRYADQDGVAWAASGGRTGQAPTFTSTLLDHAGLAVMRSGWDPQARYLLFDGGPCGGGHGHEDKLNLLLSAYGQHFLEDPGAYGYDQSPFRAYIISGRAHSQISVDGHWQKRRDIPELQTTTGPVAMTFRSTADWDLATAAYGEDPLERFAGLATQVVHRRHVVFCKPAYWVVCDELLPGDQVPHTYTSQFQFAPLMMEERPDLSVVASRPQAASLVVTPADPTELQREVVRGDEQRWLGWVAGKWTREPAPCLRYTLTRSGRTVLAYAFVPHPAGTPTSRPVVTLGGDAQRITIAVTGEGLTSTSFTISTGTVPELLDYRQKQR